MFPVEPISGKMLDYYVGRKDSFLIDLRNPKEYHTGHIKGAVNVPYEKFEEMQTYDFPKGKILVLYCDRGGASLQAARILARNGYKTKTVIFMRLCKPKRRETIRTLKTEEKPSL